MNCPICNGRCITRQTLQELENGVMTESVKYDTGEVKTDLSPIMLTTVLRKHLCPNCSIYFWTKERFDRFTETDNNAKLPHIEYSNNVTMNSKPMSVIAPPSNAPIDPEEEEMIRQAFGLGKPIKLNIKRRR